MNDRITFSADTIDQQSVEAVESDGKRTLTGYAVVWGAVSKPAADGRRYRFDKGSITWGDDVYALWHHDWSAPLAVTSNGSLTLSEDEKGVRIQINTDDTTAGRDAYERVKSRLVRGMSFGGPRSAMKAEKTDQNIWRVVAFSGDEVSITAIPSMSETSIVANSDAEKSSQGEKETRAKQLKRESDKLKLLHFGQSIRSVRA